MRSLPLPAVAGDAVTSEVFPLCGDCAPFPKITLVHVLSDLIPYYRPYHVARCGGESLVGSPAPSGAALQPGGTVAAGALPVLQHVAVCNGTLHTLASTSAISRLSSFKTHGLTPSGPNDLLKSNLFAWSETSVYLLQIHLTLLTNLLQRCQVLEAPRHLQQ